MTALMIVQFKHLHEWPGLSGMVTWLQRAHWNLSPSAVPIMALKLPPSMQYGQRTISLTKEKVFLRIIYRKC